MWAMAGTLILNMFAVLGKYRTPDYGLEIGMNAHFIA